MRVGGVINRHKMAKHFGLTIGEASFSFRRKHDAIAAEAALDGVYVVRANVPAADLDDAAVAHNYDCVGQIFSRGAPISHVHHGAAHQRQRL